MRVRETKPVLKYYTFSGWGVLGGSPGIADVRIQARKHKQAIENTGVGLAEAPTNKMCGANGEVRTSKGTSRWALRLPICCLVSRFRSNAFPSASLLLPNTFVRALAFTPKKLREGFRHLT